MIVQPPCRQQYTHAGEEQRPQVPAGRQHGDGDKGDTTILSLIAYRVEDFALLCDRVTAQAVKQHFAGIIKGEVTRHRLMLPP